MSDKLAVIQAEQTLKELEAIESSVKQTVVTFNELLKVTQDVNKGMNAGRPSDLIKAEKALVEVMKERARVEKELAKAGVALESLNTKVAQTATANANAIRAEANAEKALLLLKEKKERSAKQEAKSALDLSGAYQKLNKAHQEARIAARNAGVEHGLLSQEFQKAATDANKYDQELKRVDAALGQFNRNVGNYTGGMFGLNAQVGQVLRELPNFAISAQTGIISLTNNLPYLADSIADVSKKNKELKATFMDQAAAAKASAYQLAINNGATEMLAKSTAAQAEAQVIANYQASKGPGVFKQLASSLLSWQTLLIVGIMLITTYREEISSWFTALFKGKEEVDSMSYSVKQMQKVMEGGEIKKAYLEIYELEAALKLAKAGTISKTDALRLYNDGLGKVFGSAKNLTAVEKFLVDNKDAYIQATMDKAMANLFLAEAAQVAAKAQIEASTPIEESATLGDKFMAFITGNPADNDYATRLTRRVTQRKKDDETAANKRVEDLRKMAEKYLTKAAEATSGMKNFNLFDLSDPAKPAKVRKPKDDTERINRERYDAEKERLDQLFQVRQESIQNSIKLAKDDPFMFESAKIDEQMGYYGDLIKINTQYYDALIKNAKNFGMNNYIPDFERSRDIKGGDIDTARLQTARKRTDAVKKDFEYLAEIEKTTLRLSQAEAEGLILNDKRLSVRQREYLLSQLALANAKQSMELERTKLEARKAVLQLTEGTEEGLTLAEAAELASLNAELAVLNNNIVEIEKSTKQLQLDEIFKGMTPLVDFLTQGLEDLGLDRTARQFTTLFNKLKEEGADFSMSMEEIMSASAAIIGDFADKLVTSSKERRIADLDEQLKASQSATEQELGFIDSRLQMLNSIQDATKEQIEERNALEDEARVIREQQMMREKMIAAQKAKAEQKAQAQSVLIAASVAAINSYASLAAIPIVGPALGLAAASAALGFGLIQSAIIMSKDPVPKYFKGRDGGPSEWAWTQEKGRELITDRKGNIKSTGSDSGASMTWLDKGDKVYTASQTKDILNSLGDIPSIGGGLVGKGLMRSIPMMRERPRDNSDLIASKVGGEFERVMRKFDKPSVWSDAEGNMFKQNGSSIPQYIGRKRQSNVKVTIKRNERN